MCALFDQDSLISQSGGQTSRVDALEICLKLKHQNDSKKIKNYFYFQMHFPFTDSLSIIKRQRIDIDIYAPMGSKTT